MQGGVELVESGACREPSVVEFGECGAFVDGKCGKESCEAFPFYGVRVETCPDGAG